MRVYYGAGADMNRIKSKTAAIIDSVGVAKAEAAGLVVVDAAEAPKVADDVVVLTPDELQGNLSRQKLHANMKPRTALAFAHGLNVHFNLFTPSPVSTCSSDETFTEMRGPSRGRWLRRRLWTAAALADAVIAAVEAASHHAADNFMASALKTWQPDAGAGKACSARGFLTRR